MGILLWIIIGMIVAGLTLLIRPGFSGGQVVHTFLFAIAGALAGGLIGTLLGFGSITGFHFIKVLLSIGGSALVVNLYQLFQKA